MFPQDAITIIESNETNTDVLGKSILPNGDYYILNINTFSKDNRPNTVYCNGTPLIIQRSALSIDLPLNYHCENLVKADLYRTSSIYITYKEAGVGSSTATSTATSEMTGSISLGLSIIITLLFIITIGFIFNNLDLKIKPQWLR